MSVTEQTRIEERAVPPAEQTGRATLIPPRVIAALWFVAMGVASWINPATTEPVQATATLTFLANAGAIVWLGTLVAGAVRLRHTAVLGSVTAGFMLTGHLICGIDGHLPMTGAIWMTQLMLIATASAVSALALATRR